ncbi:GLPGLI family protein [uncultured Aquimarina sp.]|uniref:GLPGLI family protein n=1 Tax=uncultured Aquimarina sp. TaxID=575652 RepID=UPI002629ACFC|nr:GLPGLI family protein [uncultured Aquimarina sp.]
MRYFFYSILFFFFNLVKGQEYLLEYSFSDMLANKSTADLIIKGNESVFKVNDGKNNQGDALKQSEYKPNTLVLSRKNTDKLSAFSYTNQNEIFVRIPYVKGREKEFVYKFNSEKLNWQITNETKQINKYSCQKATLQLHGRYYEVWFTTEIPIKFGPFRLNGLPGMIVEARVSVDSDSFTTGGTWRLLSVSNKDNHEAFSFHKNFFVNNEVMTYSDYEKAASEAMLEFKRKELAQDAAFDAKWAKEHGTEPTGEMIYGKDYFTGYLFDIPEGIREKLEKLN